MTITDDGQGFKVTDDASSQNIQNWGLTNMRERAEALGGQFQIESELGKGTRLRVEVPILKRLSDGERSMAKAKRLGRDVAVVGAEMSKFGAFPEMTTRDLFVEAFQDLMHSVDKGFDPKDIEANYIANFSSDIFEGQCHTAPIMADWIGQIPKPATRIENACASGGIALRHGLIAIASGLFDVVLVGGTEKMPAPPPSVKS